MSQVHIHTVHPHHRTAATAEAAGCGVPPFSLSPLPLGSEARVCSPSSSPHKTTVTQCIPPLCIEDASILPLQKCALGSEHAPAPTSRPSADAPGVSTPLRPAPWCTAESTWSQCCPHGSCSVVQSMPKPVLAAAVQQLTELLRVV